MKKKYLVNSENVDDVLTILKESDTFKKLEREIFFVKIGLCKIVLYQKDNAKYIIKKKTPYKEKLKNISKKSYEKGLEQRKTSILKSTVYLSDNIELTIYHDKYKGISILQIDELEIKKFKDFLLEDITNNKDFKELNLAFFDNPLRRVNIYEIFKKLDDTKGVDLKEIIKKDMKIDDAIRIILYDLYVDLVRDRLSILKDDEVHLIDIYRNRIIKIVSLLKLYKGLFEKDLVEKVIENLNYLKKNSNVICELNAIRKNLDIYHDKMKKNDYRLFLTTKDNQISDDIDRFKSFLQKKEHSIILKQLELLIKESVNFDHDEELYKKKVENSFVNKLNKRYKKLKKSLKLYYECQDKDGYKKILSKLERLELANQNSYYIDEKGFYERVKDIKIFKEKLLNILEIMINIEVLESLENKLQTKKCVKRFEKKLNSSFIDFKDIAKKFLKKKEIL